MREKADIDYISKSKINKKIKTLEEELTKVKDKERFARENIGLFSNPFQLETNMSLDKLELRSKIEVLKELLED